MHLRQYIVQTKIKDLINITNKSGFRLIRRLKGPHKTDMDINQLKEHKFSKIKFGIWRTKISFSKNMLDINKNGISKKNKFFSNATIDKFERQLIFYIYNYT